MLKYEKNVCVIVDAYSTGKFLAPSFRGRGYSCIHIKSSPYLPSHYQHNPADFTQNFVYDMSNMASLLKILKEYRIKCIISGSESGIELADELNNFLKLPGNNAALSRARRDKYVMTDRVAAAGIPTVKHIKSQSLDDILAWALQLKQFPLVLKPLESQNGDHVFFCHNEDDIRKAFQNIIEAIDMFGKPNQEVLAQSFNAGEEYIVNTISYQGQHYGAEIWHVIKLPNSNVYDYVELIHKTAPEFESLVAYTQKVLSAVGVVYGPATTELKYTRENGPLLIETSSRPMAGAPLSLVQEAQGYSQISLTIEAYLNPTDFLRRLHDTPSPSHQYAMAVALISDSEYQLKDINTKDIEKLTTLNSFILNGETGIQLHKTSDTVTAPGEVYLLSDNRPALLKDRDTIRGMERAGLYRQH